MIKITTLALGALGALTVAGCAGPRRPAIPPASAAWLPGEERGDRFAVVRSGGDAIGYTGQITAEGVAALKLADDPAVVRTLRIRSQGGNFQAGMELGAWVHDRGIDLVVVDYCVLVCANYVFPAARHKTILPGAVVAWHGDAHGDLGADKHLSPELLDRTRADEAAFFARIGVSECLTRVGDERTALDVGRVLSFQHPVGYFTLSAADMARFGVTDVAADVPRKENVNPATQRWLDLTLVTIPESLDLRTACRN